MKEKVESLRKKAEKQKKAAQYQRLCAWSIRGKRKRRRPKEFAPFSPQTTYRGSRGVGGQGPPLFHCDWVPDGQRSGKDEQSQRDGQEVAKERDCCRQGYGGSACPKEPRAKGWDYERTARHQHL